MGCSHSKSISTFFFLDICHVVSITYQQIDRVLLSDLLGSLTEMELQQWIKAMNWKEMPDGYIFINNQEENVKTKNITEKIGFDSKFCTWSSYNENST